MDQPWYQNIADKISDVVFPAARVLRQAAGNDPKPPAVNASTAPVPGMKDNLQELARKQAIRVLATPDAKKKAKK